MIRAAAALILVLAPPAQAEALYVSNEEANVVHIVEVDPATLKIVRTFPVGWRAWNLALSPGGRRLYTANGPSGDVTAIDLVANQPAGTVALGGKPWGIVAAP